MHRITKTATTLLLTVGIAGCAGGALEDILLGTGGGTGGGGAPQQGVVTAEIQSVEPRQQEIEILTQDGQRGAVLYDQNTQVVYEGQQYPVDALERGDIADLRLRQVQQGYYTDLIEVRQSVQERQGGGDAGPGEGIYRVEGTIGEVDLETWSFTLNMTQGGTVPVHLPSTAPASAREQLRQYRPGDYVRVEIRPIDQERAELVRWGWSG